MGCKCRYKLQEYLDYTQTELVCFLGHKGMANTAGKQRGPIKLVGTPNAAQGHRAQISCCPERMAAAACS